jgi:hypothetical protein
VNRVLHPELRERLCFSGACAETGPPQQSLGLLFAERAAVLGHNRHLSNLSLEANLQNHSQANIRGR